MRISKLIKDKPFKPEETLRKWINFVAKHGSLPELQPEGVHMNFIEYFCLDVIGLLFTIVFIVAFVVYKLIIGSLRCLFGLSKKVDVKKNQ